jgi:hypothetical protein
VSVWTHETSSRFNRSSESAPAYLPALDQARYERLRHCKMLYQGRHRDYFLEESRTQWRYPQLRVEGRIIKPYISMNMMKLVANTTADLLFIAPPKLDADSPRQKQAIADLTQRSLLAARFHEAAVQMSWSGGGFLESTLWRGQVYIEVVPAEEIYPQGALMPDGQYERYIRYATDTVREGTQEKRLLLETIYEPGVIRRRLRALGDGGQPTGSDLPLDQWPAFGPAGGGNAPAPEVATGIGLNTITYLANKAGERLGVSDFDGQVELQDTINAKFLQVALILFKHSMPKIRAPRSAAGGDGNLSAAAEVVYADSPDDWGYITWDGRIDSAMTDRDAAVDAFCVSAEMSPMLLGIKRGSSPESARKARLDASKDLARTVRKSLILQPAIARAIDVALRLDQATPLLRSYPLDALAVQMRDGMPRDPQETAEEIALLRPGTINMSLEAAVEHRVEDPAMAAVEIQRILAEQAKRAEMLAPSINLPPLSGAEPGELPGDESDEATERRSDEGRAA